MEFYELAKQRRSIRKYKSEQVSDEIIESLVEVSRYAPSWKNSQVTRYYAIRSKEKKAEIAKRMPSYNQTAVETAPILMVASVVKKRSGYTREGEFDSPKGKGWQMYDCGLSNLLFCLKAEELGLGTVIMGIYPEEEISRIIELPDSEEVISVIALGYPEETPAMPKRKEVSAILKYVD